MHILQIIKRLHLVQNFSEHLKDWIHTLWRRIKPLFHRSWLTRMHMRLHVMVLLELFFIITLTFFRTFRPSIYSTVTSCFCTIGGNETIKKNRIKSFRYTRNIIFFARNLNIAIQNFKCLGMQSFEIFPKPLMFGHARFWEVPKNLSRLCSTDAWTSIRDVRI